MAFHIYILSPCCRYILPLSEGNVVSEHEVFHTLSRNPISILEFHSGLKLLLYFFLGHCVKSVLLVFLLLNYYHDEVLVE